jgi:enhancing lycopene biosynthesis protein 2
VRVRRKALVILSGCGNRDGSEIHEAVCALIALEEAGFEVSCAAPDAPQGRTLSHLDGREIEPRSMLEESARIARGSIHPLAGQGGPFDVLVFPGGQGASNSLSTYATDGRDMKVRPDVRALVESARSAGKPIAAMCIAPMILAACIPGVTLTLGSDCRESADAEALGARHVECPATAAVVDPDMKVVTTPAYMVAQSPAEVLAGARSMAHKLVALLG